jgi:enoyl-CoA hydratase
MLLCSNEATRRRQDLFMALGAPGMSVKYETHGRVAVVTLDRPEVRNCVDAATARGIEAAIDQLEGDDEIWAAVITGTPPAFCAGADLRAVARGEVNDLGTERGGWGGIVRRERVKPMIAAVDGPALAGGCEIALACDLIVAGRSAKFGLPEVKRSLIATAGGLLRLPRLIPPKVAMEMALTGEPIGAARAFDLGLVNVVCDDAAVDEALALAQKISSNAPLAVQASRRLLLGATGSEDRDAWRPMWRETKALMATTDFLEGPKAFLEKREPVWEGR